MKPLMSDCSLALHTPHRRSPICRAMIGKNNRPINRAPTWLAALLLSCTLLPAAQADTLGRLFFTPQQRSQLEYARMRNTPAEGGASPVLTVNGIIQRSGGARTVWVNGVAQSERSNGNTTSQNVSVPGKSKPVRLKVGEKILLDQGTIATPNTTAE